MSNRSFTVEKQGKYENVAPVVLKEILNRRIQRYLKKRGEKIQQCDLCLSVLSCEIDSLSGQAFLKTRLEGRLNGQTINKTFRQKRGTGRAHNLTGLVLSLTVAKAVSVTRDGDQNPFGHGAGGVQLGDCIDECVASMEIILDRALGIGESNAAERWKIIQWLCWIVPSAVSALNLIILSGQGRPMNIPFVCTLITFPAMFFTVQCVGYLAMPAAFFRKDPRGRRAMSRVGVQSIVTMRILCVVLILVLSAASVLLLMLSHTEDKPPLHAMPR